VKRIVLYDASAIDRPTREDLHRLARLRLAARRGGCDLVLTGVGQRLRLLLELTGLDGIFTISPEQPTTETAETTKQAEQAQTEQTQPEQAPAEPDEPES
jgi:hypothetical protein